MNYKTIMSIRDFLLYLSVFTGLVMWLGTNIVFMIAYFGDYQTVTIAVNDYGEGLFEFVLLIAINIGLIVSYLWTMFTGRSRR